MKKHLTMLKRPLAFLLAVLMTLSTMNGAVITASAAGKTVAADDVLLEAYPELGAAEKEIIVSDYVTHSDLSYSDLTDGELVHVDDSVDPYVITASTWTKAAGYIWNPVSAEVECEDGNVVSVAMTEGTATIPAETAGLSYSVAVKYALYIVTDEIDSDAMLQLMNTPYYLWEDYSKLSILTETSKNLEALDDVLTEEPFASEGLSAMDLLDQMTHGGYVHSQTVDGYSETVSYDGEDITIYISDKTISVAVAIDDDDAAEGVEGLMEKELIDLVDSTNLFWLVNDRESAKATLGVVNATLEYLEQVIGGLEDGLDLDLAADIAAEIFRAKTEAVAEVTAQIEAHALAKIQEMAAEYGFSIDSLDQVNGYLENPYLHDMLQEQLDAMDAAKAEATEMIMNHEVEVEELPDIDGAVDTLIDALEEVFDRLEVKLGGVNYRSFNLVNGNAAVTKNEFALGELVKIVRDMESAAEVTELKDLLETGKTAYSY